MGRLGNIMAGDTNMAQQTAQGMQQQSFLNNSSVSEETKEMIIK